MAPELIDPDVKFERTPASDVYALGCTFWELSTGLSPFFDCRNDYSIIMRVQMGERPPRRVPPEMEDERAFWREIMDWQWEIIEYCWPQERGRRADAGLIVALLQSLRSDVS